MNISSIINKKKQELNMTTKTYKVHYTADVWEVRTIEANSPEEAKEKFETGDWGDDSETEQMGMENVKTDKVEEA
jgi:hypothetical protein